MINERSKGEADLQQWCPWGAATEDRHVARPMAFTPRIGRKKENHEREEGDHQKINSQQTASKAQDHPDKKKQKNESGGEGWKR